MFPDRSVAMVMVHPHSASGVDCCVARVWGTAPGTSERRSDMGFVVSAGPYTSDLARFGE
jgi:hypothetical protein